MIIVENVTKKYGNTIANKDISLSVPSGEIAVLLGPNGAGKSTIIKCICGLLRFEGKINISGFENHTVQAKRLLGYIPEMPTVYNMLTVDEHLEFIAKAYDLKEWHESAEKLLERFQLDDKKKKLGKELSKGMQQKVSICCALLPQPKAIVFDEPFVGLDPHAIRELKNIMSELKQEEKSIIISTHMIETMEDNWDITHIMQNGTIKESRRRSEILDNSSLEELFFQITEHEKNKGVTLHE